MSGKDDLAKTIVSFLGSRLKESTQALDESFISNQQSIAEDFTKHLNYLCIAANSQQHSSTKSPIAYLHIGFLRSSFITETYDFRIAMYDENFWLDQEETAIYWTFNAPFIYVQQDIDALHNTLSWTHSVSEFEMQALKYQYAQSYLPIARQMIERLIIKALDKSGIWQLKLSDAFSVVFGGHMEDGITIYTR